MTEPTERGAWVTMPVPPRHSCDCEYCALTYAEFYPADVTHGVRLAETPPQSQDSPSGTQGPCKDCGAFHKEGDPHWARTGAPPPAPHAGPMEERDGIDCSMYVCMCGCAREETWGTHPRGDTFTVTPCKAHRGDVFNAMGGSAPHGTPAVQGVDGLSPRGEPRDWQIVKEYAEEIIRGLFEHEGDSKECARHIIALANQHLPAEKP